MAAPASLSLLSLVLSLLLLGARATTVSSSSSTTTTSSTSTTEHWVLLRTGTSSHGRPTWRVEAATPTNVATAAATATLERTIETRGWHTLSLETSAALGDDEQAYAAGYLEGAVTPDLIWQSWWTACAGKPAQVHPDIAAFINAQRAFVDAQSRPTTTTLSNSTYRRALALSLTQADGIADGYAATFASAPRAVAAGARAISPLEWNLIQLGEEISDIAQAVALPTWHAPWVRFHGDRPANEFGEHCSSLVKMTADGTQLFAAHDTWTVFTQMLRIFKHMTLPFSFAPRAARTYSFSGYPGSMVSGDDYYVTTNRLVVMETTNEILNKTLYAAVTTRTVPYWLRVTIATKLATSGAEWNALFGVLNSGTYNNQWIVVDYKRWAARRGRSLPPGVLWISEQIPGELQAADQTEHLASTGFWSSFNIPYYAHIWNVSGYPAYYEKYGNEYSHDHCARANIFRREQGAVSSLDAFKRLMRYNKWQSDPAQLQDACRGISARCDLNAPWAPSPLNALFPPFGAIDSKATTADDVAAMRTHAVAGPTWDSQAPFAWTDAYDAYLSLGQPKVFAFDWVALQPLNTSVLVTDAADAAARLRAIEL